MPVLARGLGVRLPRQTWVRYRVNCSAARLSVRVGERWVLRDHSLPAWAIASRTAAASSWDFGVGAHGASEGRWLASPRLRAAAMREVVTVAVGLRLHGQQVTGLRPKPKPNPNPDPDPNTDPELNPGPSPHPHLSPSPSP